MITKESLRKTYKAVGNKRKQVYKQFIMNRLQEAAEAGECELYLEVVDKISVPQAHGFNRWLGTAYE